MLLPNRECRPSGNGPSGSARQSFEFTADTKRFRRPGLGSEGRDSGGRQILWPVLWALHMTRFSTLRSRLGDWVHFVGLSARLVGGRRFCIAPLLTLLWPAFQALRLLMGWQESVFEPSSVQTVLVGFPMIILAIGLGVRIIADEMDRRTL